MLSSGMLRRVANVRTDVSEERSASFIRVTRIGELGTTLAVTSNRRMLRRKLCLGSEQYYFRFIFLNFYIKKTNKQTPWPLVRERTIHHFILTKFNI
jgi:hypothetical protein